jgi:23S rRNA pseudouridine2605 synthase
MEQRLQKLLAAAGIGSRRSCETLIATGSVTVNGARVTEPGAKADPERDDIRVNGKRIEAPAPPVYIALNKPVGYVTTVSDPHAEHTVMELVRNAPGRIYPVGRLDADSAGLLLLTNDGAFTERLTHPRHQVPRTYRVVARGEVSEWAAADLRQGVMLDDGMTAPAVVEWVDYDARNNATIVDITLHEGRNRQARRMFEAVGYPVLALTRLRIGPIELKGLAPGTWRKLRADEVQALLATADSTPPAPPRTPAPDPQEDAEIRRRGDRRTGRRGDAVTRGHGDNPKSKIQNPKSPSPDAPLREAARRLTEQLGRPERTSREGSPESRAKTQRRKERR